MIERKKAFPILSFPAVQLLGVSVEELIRSSELQAAGMKAVADRVPSAGSVSLMDLSVEAESFGSSVKYMSGEVPTITGRIVTCQEDAEMLVIPEVGAGRTGICIEGIRKAVGLIKDRPVFAGMIGPFSLAGRLLNINEIMLDCYDEPEMVHIVMEKATAFLRNYAKAFRETGAAGIVMAEPLTGLLSPALAEEFSHPYVREIVEDVQSDDFSVIYHNCGDNTVRMANGIFGIGAAAYHFGDAIDMTDILPFAPEDAPVMGNISPSKEFCNGTPETIYNATVALMEKCSAYSNFLISSGCDIPPKSPWENIDAFFRAVEDGNKAAVKEK